MHMSWSDACFPKIVSLRIASSSMFAARSPTVPLVQSDFRKHTHNTQIKDGNLSVS
jgi:hypothetical protein